MTEKEEAIQKILLFRQKTTEAPIEYAISPMGITGEDVGWASAADNQRPELSISGRTYRLDLTAGGDGAQESAQVLDGSGNVIGNIVPWSRTSKSVLARSEDYDYRVMTFDSGLRLFVYEVGLGANGHFWCVYEDDDRLVAMIQKSSVTKDSKDVYELYLDRTELADAAALLALYIDASAYARVDENGFNRENVVTTAKALIRKYDPDFIQSIRAELDAFRSTEPEQ